MIARTTQDYERMARMHTVACCEPAFWAGYDRQSSEAFYDYFYHITEFEQYWYNSNKTNNKTKRKCQKMMDYAATYPDIFIQYYTRDLILNVDSDAEYLVAPKAKSRISGHFNLSDHLDRTQTPNLN